MSENSMKSMNPLMVIAATVVIITCLLAVGVMVGIVPSPMSKDADVVSNLDGKAPVASSTTTTTTTTKRAAAEPRASTASERERERAADRRDDRRDERRADRRDDRSVVGSTTGTTAGGTVAGSGPGRNVAAVCNNCGVVTSVNAVKQQGEAGLIGPIAGGALGGLAGSQIGGGSGKTIATIVGAAGGAVVGTEVERRQKSTTSYTVGVRLNDGTTRSFNFGAAPGFNQGDRVKVVDGSLVRDS